MSAIPQLVHRVSSAVSSSSFTDLFINVQDSLAGNCLVLKVECPQNVTISATDNKDGSTWGVSVTILGGVRMVVLLRPNVAAGTNQIHVVFSGAANTIHFDYQEWCNVLQDTPANVLAGSSSATFVSSGNSVPAGSFTPSVSGCAVIQYGSNNQNADNTTEFTKGSGFALISAQKQSYTGNTPTGCSQYIVQGTAAAINPTYTYSGALNTSDTIAVALKPSASAAGTPAPTDRPWVAGIQMAYGIAGGATILFQFPHVGNLIHVSSQNENTVSGITDSDGNTYQTAAAQGDMQPAVAGAVNAESWRALGVSPNTDLRTGVLSVTVVTTTHTPFVTFYDIINANPVQGTAGRVQTVKTSGNQSVNGDLVTVTITPQNQNSLIIGFGPVEGMTISGLVTPTTANGGAADIHPFTGQDGNRGLNNDDMWMHYYNGASLAAVTLTYSTQGAGLPGVGGWGSVATEYKGVAGVGRSLMTMGVG